MRTKMKLLLVLLAAAVAGIALVLLAGVLDLRPAARAYTVEGPVRALRAPMAGPGGALAAVTPEMTEQEAAAALQTVVDGAVAAGANTLLFEVQSAEVAGVYYDDKEFAPVNSALDPLKTLCALAEQAGVQVIAVVEPFAAGPADKSTARGTLASDFYSETLRYDGGLWFNPLNVRCVDRLAAAYARLIRHYPVAGVVFSGLEFGAGSDALAQGLAVLGAKMEKAAGEKAVGLTFDSAAAPLTAAQTAALTAEGFDLLLPRGVDGAALQQWRDACPDARVLPCAPANDPGGFSALLRTLSLKNDLPGAVLGDLTAAMQNPADVGLMVSYFCEPVAVSSPGVSTALAASYPPDGSTVTSETVVILGTSDPTRPLTVSSGGSVLRAQGGSFAVEVPLQVGRNEFTLSQEGGGTAAVTVIRREPAAGGGGSGAPKPDTSLDGSLAGRYVEVTAQLASTLNDPGNDDAIAMTVKQGARISIQGTVETLRSGKITTAYLLSSGDYLLAGNAQLVEDGAPTTFSAPEQSVSGRGDLSLKLAGGTPMCYDDYRDGVLTLKFYDTALGFDVSALQNDFVAAAAAEPLDPEKDGGEGIKLSLEIAPGSHLWGYDVTYAGGVTTLYLQKAPVLGTEPGRPLAGVTVLLDAGHGGTDTGAAGIGGATGTAEKDVNLALTLAARDRLEQLGATVLMTRTDDSFPTLQERWAMEQAERPDFFIALHHNSTGLTKDTAGAKGLEVYYFERISGSFARSLMDAVSSATGREPDEPKWNYFYVNRVTFAPSVLFEFGYLVNPDEFEDCVSEQGIRAAADGVAEGVLRSIPVA